ncbi:hypothetical protein, partial [Lysobacter enzymogenes]|uniref:hypothetical protein n=1 Tax=Lysobacter enzymogenes TaxID=69 RepID=UPI0019D17369
LAARLRGRGFARAAAAADRISAPALPLASVRTRAFRRIRAPDQRGRASATGQRCTTVAAR